MKEIKNRVPCYNVFPLKNGWCYMLLRLAFESSYKMVLSINNSRLSIWIKYINVPLLLQWNGEKIVTVFIANKIFTENGVLYLLCGNYDY